MEQSKQVAERPSGAVQREARAQELALRPPTDIFEDAEGITLRLDMPGASRERLALEVNRNQLDVQADVQIEMPQGMEPLYADVRATHYQRSFGLSSELDADRIEATLKDGVLTLRIPKRAELRPRKIEVR